jgi:U2 small nuclear ribonucleoprotein A'
LLCNLQDLEPLALCTRLQRLDLSGNAVAKKPQYRLYLIARCPSLKLLDFARVRDSERAAAAAAFGGASGAAALAAAAAESAAAAARDDAAAAGAIGGAAGKARAGGPTEAQKLALKAAIAAAATLDEVARLEKALAAGVMPADVAVPEAMET